MAVRASSSVPAVFQPVKIGEREFVDGGLVSPVPVRYAREMGAEMVIAVDISTPPDGAATDGTMKLLLQTFAIMGKSINAFELREADLVVRPAGRLFGHNLARIAFKRHAYLRQFVYEFAQLLNPELNAQTIAASVAR